MKTKLLCILLITISLPLLTAQDIEPVLTGYSDLLKVADYDYNTAEFRTRSSYACSALRDGKVEEAIQELEKYGYDFIHNYPMIACEDDPNNGAMLNHFWSNNPNYNKFFQLVNYIVIRDRAENGVSGWDSPYCREIFNLRNPRGETLLDQITATRSSFLKGGFSTEPVDKVIDLITKLGAKTADQMDAKTEE